MVGSKDDENRRARSGVARVEQDRGASSGGAAPGPLWSAAALPLLFRKSPACRSLVAFVCVQFSTLQFLGVCPPCRYKNLWCASLPF
jgi:hypothetical protein